MSRRYLIVNADDFGRSPGINRGVIRAHERGIVTSASLMTRFPSSPEAASYALHADRLSLGLHVDLGEWVWRDGVWSPVYTVVPTDDAEAVEAEVMRQLDSFLSMAQRPPTHLDSHQHVHQSEPVRSALVQAAERLGVSLRNQGPIRHCGNFYGQDARGTPHPELIAVDSLISILRNLPTGVTELGCHPGVWPETESTYGPERPIELETLCNPSLREVIKTESIILTSFRELTQLDVNCHEPATGATDRIADPRLSWGSPCR